MKDTTPTNKNQKEILFCNDYETSLNFSIGLIKPETDNETGKVELLESEIKEKWSKIAHTLSMTRDEIFEILNLSCHHFDVRPMSVGDIVRDMVTGNLQICMPSGWADVQIHL